MDFCISIHAPRVGSDDRTKGIGGSDTAISIHAPRVGSDMIFVPGLLQQVGFQSTLPVWGATSIRMLYWRPACYFNPRSPCGERLVAETERLTDKHFNPRSPCGERLPPAGDPGGLRRISIHAPRVGSDQKSHRAGQGSCNFNPRSPCGERRTAPAWSNPH